MAKHYEEVNQEFQQGEQTEVFEETIVIEVVEEIEIVEAMNPIEFVKATLKIVEKKRAAFNKLEQDVELKIEEAKAKAEKAYAVKLAKAESELEAALENFRNAAAVIRNGPIGDTL